MYKFGLKVVAFDFFYVTFWIAISNRFLLFVWVWAFLGCHKTASGTSCFLLLQRFSTPI